ncbi:MAG: hypothetical protein ABI415_11910 [Flavitalea sp.]
MIKNGLAPVIALFAAILLFSCGHKDNTPPAPINADGGLNFPCLRYDSAKLEYRLDSIHNRGLKLQIYVSNAGDNNTAFQLISYAFDTLGDHNNSWMPDTLTVVKDSLPKAFTGRIAIGNNELTREQLYDVLNKPDGKRVSYDYMLFTPVVEGVFNHLVYRIRPIKNGEPAEGNYGKMQITTPMPPSRVWE